MVDTNEELEMKLESSRWKNRRRMAWVSLMFLIFVGLWSMFYAEPEKLKAIEEILSSVIFTTASVVGVYMGLATWQQMGKK